MHPICLALRSSVFALAMTAYAGVFIPATVAEAPVGGAQPGLWGFFWAHPDGNLLQNTAAANAWMIVNPYTATFVSSSLRYPIGGHPDTIGELLGPDAGSLVPVYVNPQRPASVWLIVGYIYIDAAADSNPALPGIQMEFGIVSDDASRLTIGGQRVLTVGGPSPDERAAYIGNDYREHVTFEAPGFYPLEVKWWDWYGGIQFRLFSNIPGVPSGAYEPIDLFHLPSDRLFRGAVLPAAVPSPEPVPEPSSMALGALGLGALWLWRRVRSHRAR